MPRSLKYRSFFVFSFLFLLFMVCLLYESRGVYAHSPHDVIDVLEISPDYDYDKTVFIAIGSSLKKSRDGGYSWKTLFNGLDNKHPFTSIAISPSFKNDRTIFVSSRGDGIYRSQNKGNSWGKVNDGLSNFDIHKLAISPNYVSDKILLAAGSEGGLYKTKNRGKNWYQVKPDNIKITAITFYPLSMQSRILAGDHSGNLYSSRDGGEKWQQFFQILNSGSITSIAISPYVSSDDTLFVGTEKMGVFKTVDGGASFVRTNGVIPDNSNIQSLAISSDYGTDATIFASAWHEAVFCSNDDGNTWKKYTKGITWDPQADEKEYWAPYYKDLRISRNFSKDRTVFLGGFDGLFKSIDGGQTWTQIETLPLRLIKGLAISPKNERNASIVITTYGGGVYITYDKGVTWTINNKGLRSTRLSDIVFSPNYDSDDTMYSASYGNLLKSTDRGKTWSAIYISTKSWRKRIISILKRLRLPTSFMRKNILNEYEKRPSWPTVIAISPNFSSDRTIYFGTRWNGIFRSVDGGLNNSIVWYQKGRSVKSLTISPAFAVDRTIFSGISGVGVYRTMNGGDTWQPANSGLSFPDAWLKSKFMLVISPNYKLDKTLFAGSSEGLFKTTNGGTSWQQIKKIAYGANDYIIAMAISPNYQNDKTLIVSIKGKVLFKSENGGTSFSQIATELIEDNYALEMIKFSASYAMDNTIYASSAEELFLSTDAGNTWRIITRPVRYENHRDVIQYEGKWQILRGNDFSATSVSYSNVFYDKATLSFVGSGITWIGTTSDNQGKARVYVDGNHMADVDQFSETRNFMVRLYSITDLPFGPHSMTVEVADSKNQKSKGYRIEIDAFDVFP